MFKEEEGCGQTEITGLFAGAALVKRFVMHSTQAATYLRLARYWLSDVHFTAGKSMSVTMSIIVNSD